MTDINNSELKACPFCGSNLIKAYIGVAPEDWIECMACNARSGFGYGDSVIKKWNTRISDIQDTKEKR